MKHIFLLAILFCFVNISFSQNSIEIKNWLATGNIKISKPAFYNTKDINNKEFGSGDFLKNFKINVDQLSPELNTNIAISNETFKWNQVEISDDSIITTCKDSNSVFLLATYISVDQWVNATIKLKSNALFEVYIDNELKKSKTSIGVEEASVNVKLNKGKHPLLLKFLTTSNNTKFKGSISFDKEIPESSVQTSLSPKRIIGIDDILLGTKISSFQISPSGNYLLVNYTETVDISGATKKYSILKNLKTNQNITVFRNQNTSQVNWLPRTDRLSYIVSKDLFIYDIVSANEKLIASGIENLSDYQWSPKEDFIIYTEYVEAEKPGDLKRIYGNDDRLPYFRNRSFLHLIYLESGNSIQLTSGNLSANLHDIHPSGLKALFSTTKMDYSEVPFSKQNLYEINLTTNEVTSIWTDKKYDGRAKYSPDGSKLLVLGGPECFGDLGKKVSTGKIANNFDQQLYLYDLKTKKVEPLSLNFDPAINGMHWTNSDELLLDVSEKDYQNLYKYSIKSKKFQKIEIKTEVLGRINYAYSQPVAVYSGTSISTPNKLYLIDFKNNKNTEIAFPEKEKYSNIEFGTSEKWNFVNKNKTTIYGRIYYPPGYDKSKKYPVIVNYYGGTLPIERSFGGRYPANIWTANGYIVYIMQPSGATGFGQEFSALHVNGWGFDAIDDIIDGTKEFLKTHPSADAENVGCIGASYGGYTTMLLQTRTDIFKTAISHAGISSITSYWGEGYWGYSYSAVATANSYPWNRKEIYVENSPLYNADKFKNSILLLHGTADTNVPVGESLQYYAALKILGKDVEMVLVDGQNHWIIDLKKRKQWHYTIMSWFDKKLKNQPQEWEDLYPEKNL